MQKRNTCRAAKYCSVPESLPRSDKQTSAAPITDIFMISEAMSPADQH